MRFWLTIAVRRRISAENAFYLGWSLCGARQHCHCRRRCWWPSRDNFRHRFRFPEINFAWIDAALWPQPLHACRPITNHCLRIEHHVGIACLYRVDKCAIHRGLTMKEFVAAVGMLNVRNCRIAKREIRGDDDFDQRRWRCGGKGWNDAELCCRASNGRGRRDCRCDLTQSNQAAFWFYCDDIVVRLAIFASWIQHQIRWTWFFDKWVGSPVELTR